MSLHCNCRSDHATGKVDCYIEALLKKPDGANSNMPSTAIGLVRTQAMSELVGREGYRGYRE